MFRVKTKTDKWTIQSLDVSWLQLQTDMVVPVRKFNMQHEITAQIQVHVNYESGPCELITVLM